MPDAEDDPGLDRIQVYAYYNRVFALSPRLDLASGTSHPDPQTQDPHYRILLGGRAPRCPVAVVRSYAMLQNEALVLYRDGLLGVAGTQTSRGDHDRPYPGLVFPSHLVPTAIAVTASNEFALVTLIDTRTQRGVLAVVALEGKYLPFHTWPYMALPNQGCFSEFKLLGYVDLPMARPTAITAASNGWWGGPSQTGNKVLSQIDLADDGTRAALYQGDPGWSGIVATKGYAVVIARDEDKVALVDLTPLFAYARESYLASAESFAQTLRNRGPAPEQWPQTFAERASIRPRVTWTGEVKRPTATLAGLRVGRWSKDRFKAYVACEDGTVHIYDASSLMARFEWEQVGRWAELGTFKIGRNPVSLVPVRFGDYPLPLLPKGHDGQPAPPDELNNTFYAACRGSREIVAAVTWEGQGTVYRRIRDVRMGDPVAVSVAIRGNMVSVADFAGKKVLSFRIGAIVDRRGKRYGAGADGNAEFEFAGELPVAGHPFSLCTANVN